MYEVELKVELTDIERQKLLTLFKGAGFQSKGVTPQHDLYIEAKESPYGGFDLKRYRNEDGNYIYTEKVWEMIEGEPTRKEIEHAVSKEAFDAASAQFPDVLVIQKDREWFSGSYEGEEISITIDAVQFNHSAHMRYFIEAEIGIEDKHAVVKTKNLIKAFLKSILGKSEIIEAPGMFTMAFKRL